ncbi:MAG: glutamate racemase [Treponema sp.]|jgi:glutamate racemase|nr:glutamate racemase [Treponema sp.]
MKNIQILFLDSGTGGLPYMIHLKEIAPEIRCVYVGDTANFPYGEKTLEQIKFMAAETVERAIKRFNPQIVVVACNTISVAALKTLRARFSIPFVGTVPAIKLAAALTENKKIGLLATRYTIEDSYTTDLINQFASDCSVFKRGDAELISFIEHNLFTASYEEKLKAVKPAVDFFKKADVDTVVLACTHFLHLISEFKESFEKNVKIVDSRDGVIKQAMRLIKEISNTEKSNDSIFDVADMGVFVTSLRNKDDEYEYRNWCNLFNVPFLGLLN